MIAMLSPDAVANWWDLIKVGVKRTLPAFAKNAPVILSNVLEAVFTGELKCWCIYDIEDGESKTYGFLLTYDIVDFATRSKGCVITSLFTYRFLEDDLWVEFIRDLREVLKPLGYGFILAWTPDKRIVQMAEKSGGDVSNTLMFTEV